LSVQCLDRTLRGYRIGDPGGDYPIFDAAGSMIAPGRWNDVHTPVIYTSEHYSTAMLEKLAHLGGLMPPNQYFIEIDLPKGLTFTRVTKDTLPAWADADQAASQRYGVNWATRCDSALLIVPSYVARMEHNIIINPHHEQFGEIRHALPTPIWWDKRLFGSDL
jgi:RES domain-containing protein